MRLFIGFVLCLVNLLDILSLRAEAVGIYHLDINHKGDPHQHISRRNDIIKCGCSLVDSSDSGSRSDSDSSSDSESSRDSESSSSLDHNHGIVIEGNQHYHKHNHNYVRIEVSPDGDIHDIEEHYEEDCSPEHEHNKPVHSHGKPVQRPRVLVQNPIHNIPKPKEVYHDRDQDYIDDAGIGDGNYDRYHPEPTIGTPVQGHGDLIENPIDKIIEPKEDYHDGDQDYIDDTGIGDGTYDRNHPEPNNIPNHKVCNPMMVCEAELQAIINKLSVRQQLDNQTDDYYYDLQGDHIDDKIYTDNKTIIDEYDDYYY